MSDFSAAFAEAEANVSERQEYLGAGKHTVTVRSAEIKTGDEARPKWATKSLNVMLGNDDGITFTDIELDPLTFADGTLNNVALSIATTNLKNLGCNFDSPKDIADFSRQVEAFVMSGAMHGAEVKINITEKVSNKINPNTNSPYVNRNVYINELVSPGLVDSMGSVALEPAVI